MSKLIKLLKSVLLKIVRVFILGVTFFTFFSDKIFFHNKSKIEKPIFIIGVPRCGSTLIEKIIASGSQYIPIGEETGIIDTVVENLINHKQSLNLDIENIQTKIVEKYKQKGLVQEKSDYMFTDKSLENFFYIDIIKKAFPDAKIINCQ